MRHLPVLACCLLTLVSAAVHTAEPAESVWDQYIAHAHPTRAAIEVDGRLNEADWNSAEPLTGMTQFEPDEGLRATESTEVRILYDAKNLYFGFTCHESDMDRIVANEMRRDARLHENDNVYIMLDTYNDRRSGFFFRVNPLGTRQDSAVTDNGDTRNENWNAVWEAETSLDDDKWTAEIAIPFGQLRYKQNGAMVWGMNVGRAVRRKQEEASWIPLRQADGFAAHYQSARLGQLTGIENIATGANLEFLPYALPGITEAEGEDQKAAFEVGFDAKYGVTPNITADVTFNTDFAQVEADEEQVNLTRFSLFFPEKRPFFLEGAGLFDFGIPRTSFRRPPPLLLFYSRRIGLEEGDSIPLILGGKLTGKVGPYSAGVLNVTTDAAQVEDVGLVPRRNFTVMRAKRDVLAQSSIGFIAVNRQDDVSHNRAGGIDFLYRPTSSMDFRAVWARTSDSVLDSRSDAAYLGGGWSNEDYRVEATYSDIEDNFEPAVGFVRRDNMRRLTGEARYTPLLKSFGLRRWWFGPELDYTYDRDGKLLTRSAELVSWFELARGGSFAFFGSDSTEYLDEEFEIRDGIFIPVGTYGFRTLNARVETDEAKMLSLEVTGGGGGFFDGSRGGIGGELAFRPSGRFNLRGRYRFDHVDLPAGEFNANILATRVDYAFMPDLVTKLFTQWNSDAEVITMNFLLSFLYRPGSNLFLAFNRAWDHSGDGVELVDSALVAKLTYWWNP
ncbi:hypothetical protein CMK11_16570 [Candidatus Poribacteria bacterium]|nr:hypothetical protein [Candidatus Poribacteria bacterium]